MGDVLLAQEVVSDTVLDALTGITKLKNPDSFEPWILKILTTN